MRIIDLPLSVTADELFVATRQASVSFNPGRVKRRLPERHGKQEGYVQGDGRDGTNAGIDGTDLYDAAVGPSNPRAYVRPSRRAFHDPVGEVVTTLIGAFQQVEVNAAVFRATVRGGDKAGRLKAMTKANREINPTLNAYNGRRLSEEVRGRC